ncbi:MAG: peptidylprolyl isomerase [bacterium]
MLYSTRKTLILSSITVLTVFTLLAGVVHREAVAQPEISIDPAQSQEEESEEEVDLPDGVAIEVGDKTVKDEELEEEVEQVLEQQKEMFEMQGQEMPEKQVEQLRNRAEGQVARQKIDRLLLLEAAQDEGIEISGEDAEKFMEEQFENKQEREKALKQMGISQEDAEDEVREMLIIQEYMDKEIGEIDISEEEAREFFEQNRNQYQKQPQVRARHILKETEGENESSEMRKELEEIKGKIEAGEAEFSEMAMQHSDDPSAESGGDLGFFTRKQMVKPFAEAAFDMEPGEIKGPVETQFGLHLIKVEEVKEGENVDFKDVRNEVQQQLKQQQNEAKAQQVVQQLREETDVEVDSSIQMPPEQPRGGQGGQPTPAR